MRFRAMPRKIKSMVPAHNLALVAPDHIFPEPGALSGDVGGPPVLSSSGDDRITKTALTFCFGAYPDAKPVPIWAGNALGFSNTAG